MEVPLRKADKKPLNNLLAKVRFKRDIKRVQTSAHKAFVMIQGAFGLEGAELTDFTMRMEQASDGGMLT